ncbi:MAG: DUF420 domain-containing protein [Gammaproteobacteria bacterium]|nr:DUF420 domain-containing protein [Gammaproteobacteria bacterium]
MDAEALGNFLAPVNASLNLLSTSFLVAGFAFIRARNIPRHRLCMIAAASASGLFLVFYVIRFSLTGTHVFAGEGTARVVYLAILFSHMVLAVVVAPLIIRLLFLAGRKRFTEHARLARWTFPIWLYVSVTGLVVYAMLYHVYGYVQ